MDCLRAEVLDSFDSPKPIRQMATSKMAKMWFAIFWLQTKITVVHVKNSRLQISTHFMLLYLCFNMGSIKNLSKRGSIETKVIFSLIILMKEIYAFIHTIIWIHKTLTRWILRRRNFMNILCNSCLRLKMCTCKT